MVTGRLVRDVLLVAAAGVAAGALAGLVAARDWEMVGGGALVALFGLPGPVVARLLLATRWPARRAHAVGAGLTLAVPLLLLGVALTTTATDGSGPMALFMAGVTLAAGVGGCAVAVWQSWRPPPGSLA